MSSINLQQERLKAYIDAEKKVLISQEYQDGNKRNRRADLNRISEGINEILATGAGANHEPGSRSRRIIFRD